MYRCSAKTGNGRREDAVIRPERLGWNWDEEKTVGIHVDDPLVSLTVCVCWGGGTMGIEHPVV